MDTQDITPGIALRNAAEKADNLDVDACISISVKTGPNGSYDTICGTCNLTYTQAIALLEIQKARLVDKMLRGAH